MDEGMMNDLLGDEEDDDSDETAISALETIKKICEQQMMKGQKPMEGPPAAGKSKMKISIMGKKPG